MSVSHSVISVRTCSRDPPSSVRHWLNIFWRLQKRSKPLPVGLEDRDNHLIRENQRQAVMQESCMSVRGSSAWRSTVNTTTGRDTQPQLISSVIHPDTINALLLWHKLRPWICARIPEGPLHVVTHFFSKQGLLVARMSSHTGFLGIFHMILSLLLLMCLTARCDNIKFHPLGRWQSSSVYQRSLHWLAVPSFD